MAIGFGGWFQSYVIVDAACVLLYTVVGVACAVIDYQDNIHVPDVEDYTVCVEQVCHVCFL